MPKLNLMLPEWNEQSDIFLHLTVIFIVAHK